MLLFSMLPLSINTTIISTEQRIATENETVGSYNSKIESNALGLLSLGLVGMREEIRLPGQDMLVERSLM